MKGAEEKRMGWEVARELEESKPTIMERLKPERGQVVAALWGFAVFFVVFLISCWLAENPFQGTGRLPSALVKAKGWVRCAYEIICEEPQLAGGKPMAPGQVDIAGKLVDKYYCPETRVQIK